MKLYKFLREGMKSNSGNTVWVLNEWQKEEGTLYICHRGFHASKEIGQAFSYVQGEILAEVEVRGESIKEENKECWSEMRVTKVWKWQKKDSVALSIFSAELCIKNYEKVYPNDTRPREAIEAAKRWLLEPTSENESAAASAAESAGSAAWSTWSAASAAWSATWSAASAAESAASAAESARSAWYASESAWSAARSAWSAWSASEYAWSAARSAARKKITKQIYQWFEERLNVLDIYEL